MSISSRSAPTEVAIGGAPRAPTTRPWMAACAAGCLIFLGALAAGAWQVRLSLVHGLGRWGSEGTWLGLPDVFEWLDRPGGRAILLPAALIIPLLLPIRRSRHWWLPIAVLLGSWALGSMTAAALGGLGLAGDEVGFPDTDTVTAVAFLVTVAHLVQRSLTSRLVKVGFWTCGGLLVALASLDPVNFDPAHALPLGRVAGAGFGLACAAAAAWWDEATPRPAPCGTGPMARPGAAMLAGRDGRQAPDEADAGGSSGPGEATPLMARALYYLYEQHLLRQVQRWPAPRHVGVILDGNRRYARQLGLTDLRKVYRLGAQKLDGVLDWCAELRIPAVTLWVCSTDNLGRSSDQVSGILAAVEAKLKALAHDPQIQRQQVRVQAIGRLELLPGDHRGGDPGRRGGDRAARRDHADHRRRLRRPRGDRRCRPRPARRRGRGEAQRLPTSSDA